MGIFQRKKGAIIKIESGTPDSFAVEAAKDALAEKGVIAFPTDTVYGLGCRADLVKAVKAIYKLKGRNSDNPLILFIGSANELGKFSRELPEYAGKLTKAFWPGPLTLVVKASEQVKDWKLDKNGTIGLRNPAGPLLSSLVKSLEAPLATTSANRSGEPECYSAKQVMESLPGPVDLMLDGGEIPRSSPSTVLDISSGEPVVLRKGAVSVKALSKILDRPVKLRKLTVTFVCTGNTCRSPMAEGYLRYILPAEWREKVRVNSCGTAAMPGMPAMANSQQAAMQNGFDISLHRASSCTRDGIVQADLIVAMEEKHRQEIKKLVPDCEAVLLAPDGVPDPIGGTLDDYLRTLDLIKNEMPDVLQAIKEKLE